MSIARQRLGAIGEAMAVRHLEAAGLRVLVRNWRCQRSDLRGELDVVAWDGTTLVFCEVKTRRNGAAGGPLAAVTGRKQAQLRRLAAAFLAETRVPAGALRFDVVAVSWPDGGGSAAVEHLRGVF